jgi:hypothetical protein
MTLVDTDILIDAGRGVPEAVNCLKDITRSKSSAGDSRTAQERLENLATLALLEVTEEAVSLAQELLSTGAVPEKAAEDALHLAIAVTNGVEYLLTWNCKHLANATMRTKIEAVCRSAGYEPRYNAMWEDPIVAEVRKIREAHAAQFNYNLKAIYQDLKQQEQASERVFVSYPPRLARPIKKLPRRRRAA